MESDFGSFQTKIIPGSKHIQYIRTLIVESMQLPASSYGDFRNFFQEVSKRDKMKLVLVKK